jgi:AraC family transcriptional regulator
MDREPQRREIEEARPAEPRASLPWASSAAEGLVRVREYRCTACDGDAPQAEQFDRASIAIVRSGVFGIRTGKRTQILSTGFLLLGNAGQGYEASHDHGVGDLCLVFDFHGRALEDLAQSLRRGVGSRPFAINVLPPDPRVDAFRRLAQDDLSSRDSGLGLEEVGLSLAAHVLALSGTGSARSSSEAPDNRRARDNVVAAIALIERSAAHELCLSELAGAAGLSPFHFLRLFKRETGVTPHRFLVQTRLRRAVDLLRDTSRPVTEIAFDVGFTDLSNFINAFRREIGVSPRQYRQSGLRRAHELPAFLEVGQRRDSDALTTVTSRETTDPLA